MGVTGVAVGLDLPDPRWSGVAVAPPSGKWGLSFGIPPPPPRTGVAVAVAVGAAVAVGGTGVCVAVGGTGVCVAVGGTGVCVAVGGTGVSVAVGGTGVSVAVRGTGMGTAVAVAAAVEAALGVGAAWGPRSFLCCGVAVCIIPGGTPRSAKSNSAHRPQYSDWVEKGRMGPHKFKYG